MKTFLPKGCDTDKLITREPAFRLLLFWVNKICIPKVAISPTYQYF